MKILIEEYKYNPKDVQDLLQGLEPLPCADGKIKLRYVGYYYNTEIEDCVFILPKVLLEGEVGKELVFDKKPEDIIDLEKANLEIHEKDFIYEFAVWIYRAIWVFWTKNKKSEIIYHQTGIEVNKGRKRVYNTFLDILLALLQFNKENQNFFFFVLKNLHAGHNKINWTRTISTTRAIIQDNSPIYLNPVNKKRVVNFDEELLVIFFSIINYIGDKYGFEKNLNCNIDIIKGKQFEMYINGLGRTRLRQIKYKYFSDKALELWDLCYAFFDQSKNVKVNTQQKEYLLAYNFNIVFEAMIDELIGTPHDKIPKGLKDQEDGKRVDHMYTYKDLMTYSEAKEIYYVGDSKYYKRNSIIEREAEYKQFTYVRNVIQWNLDLFSGRRHQQYDAEFKNKISKLRDDVTEGYNVTPNFFISARIEQNDANKFDYNIDNLKLHFNERGEKSVFDNIHFENRLFDRDTLLISHYDVNFLFVVSLYARNNSYRKKEWRKKVHEMFRKEIQSELNGKYMFYAMRPKEGVDVKKYISENFKDILGKVYAPYNYNDDYSILVLALDKDDKYKADNASILSKLGKGFNMVVYKLGDGDINDIVIGGSDDKVVSFVKEKTFPKGYDVDEENIVSIAAEEANDGYGGNA